MGGTGLGAVGLILIGLAGVLHFGVYPPLGEMVRSQLGAATGLAPFGLGILGLALCGLGYIQNSWE